MSKRTSHYVCQSCGATYAKWAGRCDACGEWSTIVEEALPDAPPGGLGTNGKRLGRGIEFVPLKGQNEQAPRRASGIAEFDRVLGGGLVRGSAVLIGGDPGIGKSTLLLQAAAALSKSGKTGCA